MLYAENVAKKRVCVCVLGCECMFRVQTHDCIARFVKCVHVFVYIYVFKYERSFIIKIRIPFSLTFIPSHAAAAAAAIHTAYAH